MTLDHTLYLIRNRLCLECERPSPHAIMCTPCSKRSFMERMGWEEHEQEQ